MEIFFENSEINSSKNTIVTVGTFDGVHKGHLNIINLVTKKAVEKNGRSVVITFEPHPRTVVSENYKIKILTTLDEKKKLLDKLGIENLMVINFTKEFSHLSAAQFIRKYICDKTGANHIVIGHDHRFGNNRDGDEQNLREIGKKLNFEVSAVPAVKIEDEIISSTKIRKALLEGDIQKANSYLGWNYSFTGKVIEGARRGRLLGFPTANVQPENENKLIPGMGVYLVKCSVKNKEFFGLLNIGKRPTFENSARFIIEAFIFNFNEEIYNEQITIEFIDRLRDEKKFESKEALIEQIKNDVVNAEKILGKLN